MDNFKSTWRDIYGNVKTMGKDKFIKSWKMKNPKAKHTLVIELYERADGSRYRKARKE